MGLFDTFKSKKEPEAPKLPEAPQAVWDKAFSANVRFYGREGEGPFGALVLTEGVETILPTAPWEKYGLDGKPVADWRLVLVSITSQGILGMMDYREAMARLEPYLQGRREGQILTKGLTKAQMERLLK